MQPDGPATGTWVEYVGPDEPEHGLSFGLRGRVIDQGQWPHEVCVDFGSSGPTLCLVPSDLRFAEDVEQ